MAKLLNYVVITPARNEEQFIEGLIQSMVSQTHLPLKWVIVSDGSSDKTDQIVQSYLREHPWIELLRLPERTERDFAGKVACFNAGATRVQNENFDLIGNVDADITFGKDHFAFLLAKFAADSGLGVAGTPFVEGSTTYDFTFTSVDHVSGACQLFRKACFEAIGGYFPIRGGGIDWVAVTSARMMGWRTRTFTEQVCQHHRPMGTATGGKARANFMLGRQDYYLGGHPLWQIFRGCYQMRHRPYVIGGALLIAGYMWGWITCVKRPIPQELIRFHQSEQMRRLGAAFKKLTAHFLGR